MRKKKSAKRITKTWALKEYTFLRKYYRHMPTSWIVRRLGRTAYSIRWKASQLMIRKANPSVWRKYGRLAKS